MSANIPEFSRGEKESNPPPQSGLGDQIFDAPSTITPDMSGSTDYDGITGGRYTRAKSYLNRTIMDNSIRTFLVVDTALGEYNHSAQKSDSLKEKIDLRYTAGMTVAGQAYERARLPEVLGIAAATTIYREILENGWNSATATAAASIGLGLLVYAQQKVIGKNFVKTAKYFPDTYDTVNRQWPKTINAIGDAIPSEKNRIAEGYGMFGLGTTPFIASSRAANPDISFEDLEKIERRVTRRGSWFAGAVGAVVLGAKSLSVHVPSRVGEEMVKRTDQALDILSNPYLVAGGFIAWGVAKTAGTQVRKT